MQADDAAIQGLAEANRHDAEVARSNGTETHATYQGISAADVLDNDEKHDHVNGDIKEKAHGADVKVVAPRLDPNEVGAPEGAVIVDGERGEHLEPDQLRSRMTFKTWVFGNRDELNFIELPSEEEKRTLRRVPDHIVLATYLIGLLELMERFSYYGCTVVFTNFIQQPLPANSVTGAGHGGQSGALGQETRLTSSVNSFNTFWVYVTPIFGAYVADVYLGRFKTICIAVGLAFSGHLLFVGSATPSMISNSNGALALLAVGIVISGVGTGTFKSNISPLIAEQNRCQVLRIRVLETGERVIVDPVLTASRVFMYYYLLINIGALAGQLGMAYAERNVGFWLSFTLPTVLLAVAPLILIFGRPLYNLRPPAGSVVLQAFRLAALALRGRFSINPIQTWRNIRADDLWERVKPSNIEPSKRPKWMVFDDVWVSEVRRGFKACQVFILIPLWWLCYNQINNNLTSQAATMTTNGVPNDVIQNLDPIALIIFIPVFDLLVYPYFRKKGIRFTQIRRVTAGFFIGSAAMIWACVVQHYIYKTSPCGTSASSCDPSPINVWSQTGSYVFIAWSEIFVSITGLEIAFTKAPKNMRSLVTSMFLLTNAVSSAIGEAFVSVSADPLLVWNYGVFAVLSAIGGVLFWIFFHNLDKEEEQLNDIGEGHYISPKDANSTDRLLPETGRNTDVVTSENEKQRPAV